MTITPFDDNREKSMKLLNAASAAMLGLVVCVGAARAEKVTLTFGGDAYPPFESKNPAGEWEGFEVDLAMQWCAKAALECSVVDVPWDGIIPALTSKKVDAIIASMTVTEERMKTIAFSIPYYADPVALAAPKSSALDLSPESLAGKTIGVLGGTTHFAYAEKHYGASTIKVYQTADETNADLAAGRIDAAMGDQTPLLTFLATEAGRDIEIKGLYAKDPAVWGVGKGIGLRKEDAGLKARFDEAIRSTYADGTFHRIMAKYFDHDLSIPPAN